MCVCRPLKATKQGELQQRRATLQPGSAPLPGLQRVMGWPNGRCIQPSDPLEPLPDLAYLLQAFLFLFMLFSFQILTWVKHRYRKWHPGEWKQGLKPAVRWCLNLDPYPLSHASVLQIVGNRLCPFSSVSHVSMFQFSNVLRLLFQFSVLPLC